MSEIPEKHDSSLFAVPDTVISGELNYVDEVAPFTRDGWNRMITRLITSKVVVSGEVQMTEHGRRVIESLPVERNEWDEVCQIRGETLCVRLDWRDPEIAKHKLEEIRSTIKDAFERAYGMYKPDSTEPAKEQGE